MILPLPELLPENQRCVPFDRSKSRVTLRCKVAFHVLRATVNEQTRLVCETMDHRFFDTDAHFQLFATTFITKTDPL